MPLLLLLSSNGTTIRTVLVWIRSESAQSVLFRDFAVVVNHLDKNHQLSFDASSFVIVRLGRVRNTHGSR
jgi:hypothetical protein